MLGYAIPKDSRTLLSTMKEVNIHPIWEWSYICLGVETCIKQVLHHNNFSYDTISLKINTDGFPLFKSTALDL